MRVRASVDAAHVRTHGGAIRCARVWLLRVTQRASICECAVHVCKYKGCSVRALTLRAHHVASAGVRTHRQLVRSRAHGTDATAFCASAAAQHDDDT
eukprot:5029458-Pleurochrysis_carterae.AAC.1